MTTDHNEAMRLAGELVAPIGTQTSYQTAHEAAALLRKQAERIAELEAERTKLVATVAYDTTMVFDLCAERDTLRAEVERLRVDAERYEWLRGHVGELTTSAFYGLRFDGRIDDPEDGDQLDTAIDTARKATQ